MYKSVISDEIDKLTHHF